MDKKYQLRNFLKMCLILAVVVSFVIPGPVIMSKTAFTTDPSSGSIICLEQAKELILSQKAFLLNIQESKDSTSTVNDAMSVTLSQLSCESCLKKRLVSYDVLIVCSLDSQLRTKAMDLLRQQGFFVYELVDMPGPNGFTPVLGIDIQQKMSLDLSNVVNFDDSKQKGRCGTPSKEVREKLYDENLRDASDCSATSTNPSSAYDSTYFFVIPVVVHIIKKTDGTGEISNALVRSQIDILNEDYQALPGTPGADGTNVKVRFMLAAKDPNGNPTTGITRTVNNAWFDDPCPGGPGACVYCTALAWDPQRYLNIYTNDAKGYLGYVPFLPADGGGVNVGQLYDRVVILWNAFGRNAPYGPPYDQGRSATHEIGHYLGLDHPFDEWNCQPGTPPQCYTTGDLICDTPPELDYTYGCPISRITCGYEAPIHNYMDYSDDTCMTEFTAEQAKRIRCTLQYYRPNLDHSPVNVLIVHNGYGDNPENVQYYEQAVENSGYSSYTYDIYEEGRNPTLQYMHNCDTVVWFCGSGYLPWGADQDLIASYLDNWGKLFITGSDVIYIAPLSFQQTYLHRNGGGYSQTSTISQVYGHMDGVFNNVDYGIRGGDGANNNGVWVTRIDPADDMVDGAFTYNIDYPTDGGFAGIQVEGFHANAKHRVIYLGFTFESIDNSADRNTVMDRALDWLIRPFAPETIIDSGPSGNIWYDDVTFTFHGVDDQTPSGSIQYQHRLLGYSDVWSSWTSSTSAVYNNLPFNRVYTFEVRAKDDDSPDNVDPTAAQREFSVGDVQGPTVYLSGPSGTISYNDLTFQWLGNDNYSPPSSLTYSYILLEYDSSWSSWTSATATSYIDVPNGTYTFVVKGRDQALNVGPEVWTTFTIEYNPGGHSCFVGGTKVTLYDRTIKNIEEVSIGDRVLTYDENNGQISSAPVTAVFHHHAKDMGPYYLVLNHNLRVTPNHPLFVNGKWMTAGDVQIGNRLLALDGSNVVVDSIEKVFEQVPTYNLEVAVYHDYFADGILAHNKPVIQPYDVVHQNGYPD